MSTPVRAGPSNPPSLAASFGIVVGAYLVALAVAVAVGLAVGSDTPLLTVALADLAATLVIFVSSRLVNNSSMYDVYWSVVPPVIALYLWTVAEPDVPLIRQFLVVGCVWFWAIRLTANWARSWPGLDHEDWRYNAQREGGPVPYWVASFFGFHLFPTIQVYVGCLALYPAIVVGTEPYGVLDMIAVVVTVGAVLLEWVADEQLRRFNATKQPGDICTVGLWAWCRHPNYLGEVLFWSGLWLFALAADPAWWWTVVGPLAMTGMFVFASIPMIDRRGVERRPGYEEHMRTVPALIPRRPRR